MVNTICKRYQARLREAPAETAGDDRVEALVKYWLKFRLGFFEGALGNARPYIFIFILSESFED